MVPNVGGTESHWGGAFARMMPPVQLGLVGKAHAWEERSRALGLGHVSSISHGHIRVHEVAVVGISFVFAPTIAGIAAALTQVEDTRSGRRALLGNVRGARGVDAVLVWGRGCGGIEWILAAERGQREIVQIGVGSTRGPRAWRVHVASTMGENAVGFARALGIKKLSRLWGDGVIRRDCRCPEVHQLSDACTRTGEYGSARPK